MLFLLYHPLPKLSISHGGVGDAGWTSVRGRRASFIELSRSANFLIKLDSEARRNLIDSEFRSTWIIYIYIYVTRINFERKVSLFFSLWLEMYIPLHYALLVSAIAVYILDLVSSLLQIYLAWIFFIFIFLFLFPSKVFLWDDAALETYLMKFSWPQFVDIYFLISASNELQFFREDLFPP